MMRALLVVGVAMAACRGNEVARVNGPLPSNTAATRAASVKRPSTPVPVVVAEREVWVGNLIADDAGLYWSEANGDTAGVWFLPIPANGAAPRMVVEVTSGTVHAIALDAESIYFVFSPTHGWPSLFRAGKHGGPVTTIATDVQLVDPTIQYADGALYVSSATDLISFAIDGSRPPRELMRAKERIEHFEVGADGAFFSLYRGNVTQVPKTGGAVKEIRLPGSLGFWTVQDHSLYVDLDDKVVVVDTSVASPTPMPLGASGTVVGITGDQIIVRSDVMNEKLQGLSIATGALTTPVPMGKRWEELNVSAGAVWWMRTVHISPDEDRYQLVMYVP